MPHPSAQQRETADPVERSRPLPLLFAFLILGMVAFGVTYILRAQPFEPAQMGDRRTVADLRGAVVKPGQVVDGKQVFSANCVACHQATGLGLPGVFPPLDGSEWVQGDERIVANILLHGVTGPITVKGMNFAGAMPSFERLSDGELAAVAGYVRSSWSNKAAPLAPELFDKERKAGSRTTPFAGGDELKTLAGKP
jgi:mono/diheme cytochrome c family protein